MITARADVILQNMHLLGWRPEDLASKAGVALNTVRNLLDGKPVGGNTIGALMAVFPGLGFDDLFEVAGRKQREAVAQ
jgi:lambda repressor-like predicted transcriptional regulator